MVYGLVVYALMYRVLLRHVHTVCPWKGRASYSDVVVEGGVNREAAWY